MTENCNKNTEHILMSNISISCFFRQLSPDFKQGQHDMNM